MGNLFVTKKLSEEEKQSLIDEAIEQIIEDLAIGDKTAIDEMLRSVPQLDLIGFLGHEKGQKYYELIK